VAGQSINWPAICGARGIVLIIIMLAVGLPSVFANNIAAIAIPVPAGFGSRQPRQPAQRNDRPR
jgi:hypothetical protein